MAEGCARRGCSGAAVSSNGFLSLCLSYYDTGKLLLWLLPRYYSTGTACGGGAAAFVSGVGLSISSLVLLLTVWNYILSKLVIFNSSSPFHTMILREAAICHHFLPLGLHFHAESLAQPSSHCTTTDLRRRARNNDNPMEMSWSQISFYLSRLSHSVQWYHSVLLQSHYAHCQYVPHCPEKLKKIR